MAWGFQKRTFRCRTSFETWLAKKGLNMKIVTKAQFGQSCKKNRRITCEDIIASTDISKILIFCILHTNFSFVVIARLVSHHLTKEQKQIRIR